MRNMRNATSDRANPYLRNQYCCLFLISVSMGTQVTAKLIFTLNNINIVCA